MTFDKLNATKHSAIMADLYSDKEVQLNVDDSSFIVGFLFGVYGGDLKAYGKVEVCVSMVDRYGTERGYGYLMEVKDFQVFLTSVHEIGWGKSYNRYIKALYKGERM